MSEAELGAGAGAGIVGQKKFRVRGARQWSSRAAHVITLAITRRASVSGIHSLTGGERRASRKAGRQCGGVAISLSCSHAK